MAASFLSKFGSYQRLLHTLTRGVAWQFVQNKCLCRFNYSRIKSYSSSLSLILGMGVARSAAGFGFKRPDMDYVNLQLREADFGMERGQYFQALHVYLSTLRLLDTLVYKKVITEEQKLKVIDRLRPSLADAAKMSGYHDIAVENYDYTLEMLRRTGVPEDSYEVMNTLLKRGTSQTKLKKKEDALESFKSCIDILTQKLDGVDERTDEFKTFGNMLGYAYESYGSTLLTNTTTETKDKRKKTIRPAPEAIKAACWYLSESLRFVEKIFGQQHERVLSILASIAKAQTLKKDFQAADKTLSAAVSIAQKINSSQLPLLLCKQGDNYINLELYDKAMDTCEMGRKKAKENNDKDTEDFCYQHLKKAFLWIK